MLIFTVLIFSLSGCGKKYDEDDFVGKTSDQIQKEFGNFDCTYMDASEDGLYRNTKCGYTVKEAKKGLMGKSEEELFFISFDGDGVATKCTYGPRPGG